MKFQGNSNSIENDGARGHSLATTGLSPKIGDNLRAQVRGTLKELAMRFMPGAMRLRVPFAGDPYIEATIKQLVFDFGINSIIETGTNIGATTKKLACIADPNPTVWSIELIPKFHREAKENLKDCSKVRLIQGDSAKMLPSIIAKSFGPRLFLLDAHWLNQWPLAAELEAIRDSKVAANSVIMIHDIKIPGTNRGYDTYKGVDLSIDLVRERLLEINPDYYYFFPRHVGGNRRGAIFVHPESEYYPASRKL